MSSAVNISDVKNELKTWERQFLEKWGRKPTIEDIKKDPIAPKYKLHRQLSKLSQTSHPQVVSTPAQHSTSNPFSPTKRRELIVSPLPSTSHNGDNPFLDASPGDEYALIKARKRLRGESVSPSPKKGKLRRVSSRDSSPEPGFTHATQSEPLLIFNDSPVKKTAVFVPLFPEVRSLSPDEPETQISSSRLGYPKRRQSNQPALPESSHSPITTEPIHEAIPQTESAADVDAIEDALIPPSPPQKPTKATALTDKSKRKLTQLSIVEYDEGGEKQRPTLTTVVSRDARRRTVDSESTAWSPVRTVRRDKWPSNHQTEIEEDVDVQLHSDMQRILSLEASQKEAKQRVREVTDLFGNVVSGKVNPATKGDRIWEAGDQDIAGSDSEDDWDNPGLAWAAGEL